MGSVGESNYRRGLVTGVLAAAVVALAVAAVILATDDDEPTPPDQSAAPTEGDESTEPGGRVLFLATPIGGG